jgi:RES domain-containing protein
MLVYRIVKNRARVNDLSGTGAFMNGGRWNYEGTYALYTSEYRSLALLETLVHTEDEELPPTVIV